MTIDEKIKRCEYFLSRFDLNKDKILYQKYSYFYDYELSRCKILSGIFKKCGLATSFSKIEYDQEEFFLECIFSYIVSNTKAFEYSNYNYNYEFDVMCDENCDSTDISDLTYEDFKESVNWKYLKVKDTDFLDPKLFPILRDFLSYYFYEDSGMFLNKIEITYLDELLKNNFIKKECLKALEKPLMLDDDYSAFSDKNVVAWIQGCDDCGREISFNELNSMFLLTLYYVDLCFCKYTKNYKKSIDFGSLIYV